MRLDSRTIDELVDPSWAAEFVALLRAAPQGGMQGDMRGNHATDYHRPLNGTASMGPMRQLAPAPRPLTAAISHQSFQHRTSEPPTPDVLREQDRLLPMANIARLMSMELPADAKIARDAKVLMQEIASELICFLTSEANDVSLQEGRKAISKEDIFATFEKLGALLITHLPGHVARPGSIASMVDPYWRLARCVRRSSDLCSSHGSRDERSRHVKSQHGLSAFSA